MISYENLIIELLNGDCQDIFNKLDMIDESLLDKLSFLICTYLQEKERVENNEHNKKVN